MDKDIYDFFKNHGRSIIALEERKKLKRIIGIEIVKEDRDVSVLILDNTKTGEKSYFLEITCPSIEASNTAMEEA